MVNKILLNYDEYRRLKNIEQEYLKLRRKKTHEKSPVPGSSQTESEPESEPPKPSIRCLHNYSKFEFM